MLLIFLFLVNLIRAFLIIAIVLMIVRWIYRLFSPGHTENHQDVYSQNHQNESETTIKYKNQEKKNNTKNEGEYVDFEEIE
jgi:hypothetical protein